MSGLTVGSLFSGIGGLDLAVEDVTGGRVVWQSEIEPGPVKVLEQHWPGVPNLGDITAIDWTQVQPVDVLCGGFPCQDISTAGRGAGIKEGTRSGLWYRYADAVRVLRPRYVFVENVAALLVRGLDIVTGSLAELGYDAQWGCLRASDVGAPHGRNRLWLVASDRQGEGLERPGIRRRPSIGGDPAPDADHCSINGQRARPEPGSRSEADRLTLLPTPTAMDTAGAMIDRRSETGHGAMLRDLPHLLPVGGRLLPTPRTSDTNGPGAHGDGGMDLRTAAATACIGGAWGPYQPAITRWERLTRPAPPALDEKGRLNALLPEWMMGFDAGWITDHLGRGAAVKAAGNAVCQQQARAAFSLLLDRPAS